MNAWCGVFSHFVAVGTLVSVGVVFWYFLLIDYVFSCVQCVLLVDWRCFASLPNALSNSLHSKQRKISQTMQCVHSNTASCWFGLSASFRLLSVMLKLQLLWPWIQQYDTH